MDKNAAGAYVYAKASGIIGKSFVGDRARILFEQKNLQDLWSLLFKSHPPMIPETLLARQIEVEALRRFVNQYADFINAYDNPDPILIDQLYIYEAENLKEIAAALCNGEEDCPAVVDLGRFAQIDYSAWPDIKAMTKGSIFSWYNFVPGADERQKMEAKVDMQVITHLWQSLEKERGENYQVLNQIYASEYEVKNIIWALRLKLFYDMDVNQIKDNLIHVTPEVSAADPLAGSALKILDFPTDDFDAWTGWKYSSLLNPHTDGLVWQIDPVWMEQRSRVELEKLAFKLFHQYPMSVCSLVAWYKIKHFELGCVRTAVESLRLNINSFEAMDAVGITAAGGDDNG